MLRRKAIQPLCNSCKLDLFSLFTSGLNTPTRTARIRLQHPRTQHRSFQSFSAQRVNEHLPGTKDVSSVQEDSLTIRSVEGAARKAREIFGHTLPANLLSTEEYEVYERLYGPPLRESTADDIQRLRQQFYGQHLTETEKVEDGDLTLFRQSEEGELEAVEEEIEDEEDEEFDEEYDEDLDEGDGEGKPLSAGRLASIKARNALRLDMIAAERSHYLETGDISEKDPEGTFGPRTHPYTVAARYGTEPFSVTMPNRTFVEPITEMLKIASRKQLIETAHTVFGGPRLQDSVATPVKRKAEHFQQRPIALEATQARMGEMEANAYIAANMPGAYASVMGILTECRKRLGSTWLEDLLKKEGGPRILDVGAAGAGILAWQDVLRAEWARLHPDVKAGDPVPFGKATVVTGSSEIRSRVRLLLDNTSFVPRVPDFIPTRDLPGASEHDPSMRKQYDVVIAAHSLWTLKEDYMRKAQVQNYFTLLNPNGGVLIILEKGVPRGFELVAGARETLLKHHILSPGDSEQINEMTGIRTHKEPGMIIAPCTNHGDCPMYLVPGEMKSRKDWCHFSQRFVRPPFLQNIVGNSYRNHEDVDFSYVAVRRGIDTRPAGQLPQDEALTLKAKEGYEKSEIAPNPLSLPRLLLPPLKRHKHVVFDLCTPAGKIERWTTSQSFSRQSYRDARKSKWGDLWALGAKVRVIRQARVGEAKNPKRKTTGSKPSQEGSFAGIDHNVSPNAGSDRSRGEKKKQKKPRAWKRGPHESKDDVDM